MGRIVGDGAVNFDIVDVAVDPAHQWGWKSHHGKKIVSWLDANASPWRLCHAGRLTSLAVREVWASVRPASEGMARVW